jgi:hypothetical protein
MFFSSFSPEISSQLFYPNALLVDVLFYMAVLLMFSTFMFFSLMSSISLRRLSIALSIPYSVEG